MFSVLKSKLNTLINVETIRNALCPEIYLQLFVCVVFSRQILWNGAEKWSARLWQMSSNSLVRMLVRLTER